MALAAGPSNVADEEEENEEQYDEDLPFPEPEFKSMLLTDLLGLAAEFEAAAALEECKHSTRSVLTAIKM